MINQLSIYYELKVDYILVAELTIKQRVMVNLVKQVVR